MDKIKINPFYFTDNYPREGCQITITVPNSDTEEWSVCIQVPKEIENAAGVPYLELYVRHSLENALEVVRCLAKGEKPPKEVNH